jgi:hypothetical protein
LPLFFAGFFGTFKSTFNRLRQGAKTSEGESKVGAAIFSLVLSLVISPVWFLIKLFKRIKASFKIHSLEKTLAAKIDPSVFAAVGRIGVYIENI